MALPQLYIEAAFDGQRGPAYKDAVLADFPAGYTRLDSQPPTDISGNGLTMGADVAPNRPTLTTGLLDADTDQASAFNGSQRCQWNDNALLRPTAALTLEAWVKPTGVVGNQTILRKDGCYAMRLNGTGLDIILWDSGGTPNTINVASVFAAGSIYHVAMTYDGATVTPWINGVAKTTTALAITLASATNIVGIGGFFTGTSWTEQFTGTIDEVAVYGTALWPTEIEYHYEARLAKPPDQWTWTDLTSFARSLTTKRGRSNVQGHADVGIVDVLLKDADRRFEPGYHGLSSDARVVTTSGSPTFNADGTVTVDSTGNDHVQIPTAFLGIAEGWIAVETVTGSTRPHWLASWGDTSNGLDLFLDISDNLVFSETVAGVVTGEAIVPFGASGTIGTGETHLGIALWSPTHLSAAFDGGAFVTAARGTQSTPGTTVIEIGRSRQ